MDEFYPLIENFGYLVVFFGVVLGTMGIPFPSAAILLASGVLGQQGHLGFSGAIVFGILGAIVGNQIGYWVGYQAGRQFILKWGGGTALRTPWRQGRLRGALLLGLACARSACGRYEPHALGHLRLLQRPRRGGVGHHGSRSCGVSGRPELGRDAALVGTLPVLAGPPTPRGAKHLLRLPVGGRSQELTVLFGDAASGQPFTVSG
jgi:hypothetical protein